MVAVWWKWVPTVRSLVLVFIIVVKCLTDHGVTCGDCWSLVGLVTRRTRLPGLLFLWRCLPFSRLITIVLSTVVGRAADNEGWPWL
jgi:hypothetical protein